MPCTTLPLQQSAPPGLSRGASYCALLEYATPPFFQCIFVTFEQVLYVFAHIKGERFDEEDNSAKSMGIDTDKMKKDASDKAAKKAIQTARENPEQARNLAAKAATGII